MLTNSLATSSNIQVLLNQFQSISVVVLNFSEGYLWSRRASAPSGIVPKPRCEEISEALQIAKNWGWNLKRHFQLSWFEPSDKVTGNGE
jgi:hypothetical protein